MNPLLRPPPKGAVAKNGASRLKESPKARNRRAKVRALKAGRTRDVSKNEKSPRRWLGQLEKSPGGYRLVVKGKATPVVVESDVPVELLIDCLLLWEPTGTESSPQRIRPADARTFRQIQMTWRSASRAATLPPNHGGQSGPQPPGSTKIEKLDNLGAQLRRISDIVTWKGERLQTGWSELASAWRVEKLRGPIEQAFAAIGWSQIDSLIRARPGPWPDGLPALVARRRAEEDEKRRNSAPKPKGEHSDYWLADW